jgi:soluble lytic murein transglycosylase-like protein
VTTSALSVITAVLCALVLGAVGLVAVVAGSTSDASAAPSLASAAVPIPSLVPVLEEAGSLCPEISAPLLAAQIKAESDWNPNAVSPDGAEGIAQFLPNTFAVYGRDDDDTEAVSPFDAVDVSGHVKIPVGGQ